MRTVRSPMVVGRSAELARLTDALDRASAGRGETLVVVGEAGIGKSRLVEAAAGVAGSRGMLVARGRGASTGIDVPFRPWSDALLSVARRTPFPADARLAPFRVPLGVLVPDWAEAPAGIAPDVIAIGEGILRLLRVLAGEAVPVVVVEDLQWFDAESLALLDYVADKTQEEGVVLLLTVRDDGSSGLDSALDLARRRTATIVELPRLGSDDVAEMASLCLGERPSEAVVDLLARYADGLPFLVEELLGSLSDAPTPAGSPLRPSIPRTFDDDFRRRTEQLGPVGRKVLGAAAVLGRSFDWSLIGPAADLDDETVLEALREAVLVRIVEEDRESGTFRFRHGLSSEAARSLLFATERAAAAARMLPLVLERRRTDEGDWRVLAASLASEAGDHVRCAQLLAELAREAVANGALATARAVAERAVAASSDDEVRVEAARVLLEACALAGDRQRAGEVGALLLEWLGADPTAVSDEAGDVHLQLARVAVSAGDGPAAHHHLDAAEGSFGTMRGRAGAVVAVLRAQVALAEHRPGEAADRASEALSAARMGGWPDVACEALEVAGRVARLTAWEQAEQWFLEALQVATAADLTVWRVRALAELGVQEVFGATQPHHLHVARAAAEHHGAVVTAAHADLHLAALHGLRQEIDDGLAAIRRCEAAARRFGLRLLLPAALGNHALLESSHGHGPQAADLLQEALGLAGGDPQVEANLRGFVLATMCLHREDLPGARAAVDQATALLPPGSDAASGPVRDLALWLRVLDGTADSSATDRALSEISERHVLGRGLVHAAAAVDLGRRGAGAPAAAMVHRAEQALASAPLWRHLVLRHVADEAFAHGWGEPSRWLREAVAFLDAAGLSAAADAASASLRLAGGRATRRGSASRLPSVLTSVGITAREADVLALVARGLQNRAIAERLYLSVRTVEKHVERLLMKAGASTRTELAGFALRAGLDEYVVSRTTDT